jgi:hypothetical protein
MRIIFEPSRPRIAKKYRDTEGLLGFAHQASSCILLTMVEGILMRIKPSFWRTPWQLRQLVDVGRSAALHRG